MRCFVAGALVAPLLAWTDKVTSTPSLVQIDFGPYGSYLPGNGEDYCGPTASSMSLLWLGKNGFTQLAPAAATEVEMQNLVEVMGGLMNTTPSGGNAGTGYDEYLEGWETYFRARGVGNRFTRAANPNTPDLNWLANHNGNQTVVNFTVAWFSETSTPGTYAQAGGHFLTLLATDVPAGTATINNPYPSALFNVANLPSSNPQTPSVAALDPSYTLVWEGNDTVSGAGYSQLITPIYPGSGNLAVLDGAIAWTVSESALTSAPGYAPETWTLNATKSISAGNGVLEVLAPVAGAFGFSKSGEGSIVFTNTVQTTGTTTVLDGALASTTTTGSPFGTGSLVLEGDGRLELRPDGSTPSAITLSLASGSTAKVSFAGGNTLRLERGTNLSLAVDIGGSTDGTTSNLERTGRGSLVFSLSNGLAGLGSLEKIRVTGSGANLPQVTNGMVLPYLIGQDSDSGRSGAFLNYSATDGFVAATLSTGDINASTATTILRATMPQTVNAASTASVYALEVANTTIGSGGSGSVIQVGGQGAGDLGGIILNGGAISAETLSFGSGEGLIYTSNAGGGATISSTMVAENLTTFGPGNLTVSGNNSITGSVVVQSGTLVLANTEGSATGMAGITVQSDATLRTSGLSSRAAGSVTAKTGATIAMNGGTLGGALTLDNAATLQGSGTIGGNADLSGILQASPSGGGNLLFNGTSRFSTNAEFYWSLGALTSEGSQAGTAWNILTFAGDATVGSTTGINAGPVSIFLDFASGMDPDSGNAFWTSTHEWMIWNFQSSWSVYYEEENFQFSSGNFSTHLHADKVNLRFTPVPEPSTWLLVSLACLAFLLINRRGKQTQESSSQIGLRWTKIRRRRIS